MGKLEVQEAAQALNRVLAIFRDLNPEFTVQQVQTLLLIAGNPGITVREIMSKAELTSASATRNLAALRDLPGRDDGLGLADVEEDLQDRRVRHCRLTPKGERLMERVATASRR